MVQGNQLGTDFLDLSSDDDSDWVDENATRDFEEVEGLSNRTSGGTFEGKDEDRRRDKESEYLTALPPFNQIPAHDSATDELSTPVRRPPSQARQLSVKRYDRAAVVHNRGSPRSSLLSEASSDAMPQPLNVPRTLSQNLDGVELEFGQSNSSQAAHQRTPSEVESIRMNAFLNAHYATLHAIDSQQNSPPGQNLSFPESTRDGGVSEGKQGKHIRLLSPIQTTHEPDRPAHLPSHFIKTLYPFTAKKEFPPPKTRPRAAWAEATPEHESNKGIHILGIANDSEYDPRTRLERNIDAQGLTRYPPDPIVNPTKQERWNSARSTNSARESVIWLSLRRNSRLSGVADRLEQITIPDDLIKSEAKAQPSPTFKPEVRHISVDFDDMYFAQELRSAYRKLAGPRVLRMISARKLMYIRLSQISAWSGSYIPLGLHEEAGTLLAAGGGLDTLSDSSSPFTEHGLLDIYRRPKGGKVRYTWVHWARRVAASNRLSHARSEEGVEEQDSSREITTIQFVHAFSPFKILSVLVFMMCLPLAATILYIFFGDSVWRGQMDRERAEKVTPGILLGVFVGGFESVLFGAWIMGSWMWL
ncbi:hypothetical protein GRF29_96g1242361 [Pseudopithomyces chartarum]|uniref:Uncharacterized protein n=1 Tax=Pseudopithomyces chartarum TaxID=1892770 RepID=A0AAN6LZ76_9PLEO|nr:hypothetical protein GRF29_96g1242361 [Pseudopithomyces chartarum]